MPGASEINPVPYTPSSLPVCRRFFLLNQPATDLTEFCLCYHMLKLDMCDAPMTMITFCLVCVGYCLAWALSHVHISGCTRAPCLPQDGSSQVLFLSICLKECC